MTSSISLIRSFYADPIHGEVYRILGTSNPSAWFEADQLYFKTILLSERETADVLLSKPPTETAKAQAKACLSEIRNAEKNLAEPLPGKTFQEYTTAITAWASVQPKTVAKSSNVFEALADDDDE